MIKSDLEPSAWWVCLCTNDKLVHFTPERWDMLLVAGRLKTRYVSTLSSAVVVELTIAAFTIVLQGGRILVTSLFSQLV